MLKKLNAIVRSSLVVVAAMTTPLLAQSGSTSPVAVAAGTFDIFMRPDLMQALHDSDYDTMNAEPIDNVVYVSKIVGALEAPEAWYRMGQEGVLMMDPRLGKVLAGKLMTDEQFYNEAITFGFGMFMGGLEPFVEKRKESIANGTLDPGGEAAALMRGLLASTGGMGAVLADAEYDANRLMLLAQTDPDTFAAIYESLRSYVYYGL